MCTQTYIHSSQTDQAKPVPSDDVAPLQKGYTHSHYTHTVHTHTVHTAHTLTRHTDTLTKLHGSQNQTTKPEKKNTTQSSNHRGCVLFQELSGVHTKASLSTTHKWVFSIGTFGGAGPGLGRVWAGSGPGLGRLCWAPLHFYYKLNGSSVEVEQVGLFKD